MDSNPGVSRRHCSFCLQICSPVKLCSKCHKRAYCSPQCQVADWKPGGKGQGHKNWCQYECGQEDVDWCVVPIKDKGLGIVAKRTIPAVYRIIVEPVFNNPEGHPLIKDLMPENGTLMEKFKMNAFATEVPGVDVVSLRISRVNHSCNENAAVFYCRESRVNILYALREIPADQEICISYVDSACYKLTSLADAAVGRMYYKGLLAIKWNIICNADCLCKNSRVEKLKMKAIELFMEIKEMRKAWMVTTLQPAEDLLEVIDSIPLNQYDALRAQMYFFICMLTMIQDRNFKMSKAERSMKLNRAKKYISSCYDIYLAISPNSVETRETRVTMLTVRSMISGL